MATINRQSGPSLHHHNPFGRAMPDDTVIISAMTNPMLSSDLAIQQQGSWKIGMPLLNGWVQVKKFSSQEDSTVRDKVLICPFVLVEEETRANPDVPAEEDGVQRVASPVRGIFMFVHGRGPNDFRFILDSGAAVHATPRYYLLKDLVAVASGQSVRAANGKDVQIRGRGRVSLENFITLDDVGYIPGLISNIVSVSKLTDLDYIVQFKGDGCFVRDSRAGDSLVGCGRLVSGVFVLDYLLIPHGRAAAAPGPASSEQ